MGQLIPNGIQNLFNLGNTFWPARYGGLKILVSNVVQGTGAYSSCREPGSSSAYVVPTGKTFKGVAILVTDLAGSNAIFGIGYGDTAPTFGGAAAPTNPVFMVGGSSTAKGNGYVASAQSVSFPIIGFNIAAGKYPFCYRGQVGEYSYYILGYEE